MDFTSSRILKMAYEKSTTLKPCLSFLKKTICPWREMGAFQEGNPPPPPPTPPRPPPWSYSFLLLFICLVLLLCFFSSVSFIFFPLSLSLSFFFLVSILLLSLSSRLSLCPSFVSILHFSLSFPCFQLFPLLLLLLLSLASSVSKRGTIKKGLAMPFWHCTMIVAETPFDNAPTPRNEALRATPPEKKSNN